MARAILVPIIPESDKKTSPPAFAEGRSLCYDGRMNAPHPPAETPGSPALRENSQEAHFREVAEQYVRSRREYPGTRAYHRYWDDRLHAMIDPKFGPEARYLDPMCGAGLFLDTPLSRFAHVAACDLSDDMLAYIQPEDRKRLDVCLKADVRHLPFEEASYDIVLIRGGLHHVANHLSEVLAELYRVLKPGGQFVFSDPVDTSAFVALVRHLMYTRTQIFDAEEERGLTVGELHELLTRQGFERFYYEPFTHLGYCLIGNTDFLPIFRHLSHPAVYQPLIALDEVSRRLPLWNQLCWVGNFSCYKPA